MNDGGLCTRFLRRVARAAEPGSSRELFFCRLGTCMLGAVVSESIHGTTLKNPSPVQHTQRELPDSLPLGAWGKTVLFLNLTSGKKK